MELLATSLVHGGDAVLIVTPTYDQFRAIVEQRGARVVTFDYDGQAPFDFDAFERAMRTHSIRAVYLSNPNNPLGYVLESELLQRIETLCRRLSSILVVDEAYYEFCGVSVSRRVRDPDGPVIVLRTFSKAFGLAGLRIGYILASGNLMRALRKVHNPKSVTMFAKTAALAALRDLAAVQAYAGEVTRGRERIRRILIQHGARTYPSAGNYVLFEWPGIRELGEPPGGPWHLGARANCVHAGETKRTCDDRVGTKRRGARHHARVLLLARELARRELNTVLGGKSGQRCEACLLGDVGLPDRERQGAVART